ncbi:uncharacterized protein TRIADDRAFT_28825 [Trichoplax adhaerens]|uniref:GST N-terminal domain-containing protein n=1 Tax=Trichoplax adhaerens TaxID=10228 RepID=B3S448_TRIAD|nr:hypothetical protein TRIADDRAFT_28825 [Trichoplax adhaerens]EDV22577.1 hypothetical protein TRIADDRAFT_28825 [Trichoplax adhaerens]|eukprot:XP_002115121.1 hypothetical protein TRIADDRAFT_28825 [Trichoplax adhaerens]
MPAVANQDKNAILMYQFPRASTIPSASPFALKLETYFRMAGIKYESDLTGKFSKNGKIPWVVIDGQPLGDTAFITEYVNKKYNIDLDKNLSELDKSMAHSYRKMLEENTFWAAINYGRLVDNFPWLLKELGVPSALSWIAKLTVRRRLLKNMWGHGIGRHNGEEIQSIAMQDIKACAEFLDNKPFFMGDQPTSIDAVIFGFMAELIWFMPPDHWTIKLITEEYTNVVDYCERMKAKYWPDWDDNLKKTK